MPARREPEIRIFTLNSENGHVGSSLCGAWFAPCLPKNRADNHAKSKYSYPPDMSVNAGNGSRAQFRFHRRKRLSDCPTAPDRDENEQAVRKVR